MSACRSTVAHQPHVFTVTNATTPIGGRVELCPGRETDWEVQP